jgi:hypothetical protein
MNQLSIIPKDLDAILTSARTMLAEATSAAQILNARERAQIAADIAKRMAQAKHAHDDVTNRARALQGDAVALIAWADTRLADEYAAAQERGEVQKPGGDRKTIVPGGNNDPPTVADLGLSRKQMHNARIIRDAVKDDPDVIPKTIKKILSTGQQASLRGLVEAIKDAKADAPKSLKGKNPFRDPGYVETPARRDMVLFTASCRELAKILGRHTPEELLATIPAGLTTDITLPVLRAGAEALNRFMEVLDAQT